MAITQGFSGPAPPKFAYTPAIPRGPSQTLRFQWLRAALCATKPGTVLAVSGGMTPLLSRPRWYWRSFHPSTRAESYVLRLAGPVKYCHETSFIRRSSDVDVRVSDGVLGVKVCRRVDERGAGEWVTVFRADFPIPASSMRELYAAWNRRPPAGLLPMYREAAFRAVLTEDPEVVAIDLLIERRSVVSDGCVIERAVFTAGRARTVTIAVESDDQAALWRVVRSLGLESEPNRNYVDALRRLFAGVEVAVLGHGPAEVLAHSGS